MLGDVVHDDGGEAPPLLGLSAFTLFMMLSHTGGRLYLPPSLLRLGFSALMKMASFIPLSNHLGSVVRISVLSSSTVCSTWSVCTCFATSEVVELGLRCSLNLDFRDLSVSLMYVASYSSHLILYTSPTTFSLSTGSLGLTNSWRNVFVSLKYVGMPYFPNTCLIYSENPLMYGMTTGIFLYLSLSDVSFTGSGIFTSPSSLLFSHNSRRIQSGYPLHFNAPLRCSSSFLLSSLSLTTVLTL